jgi:HK97 family phage prohead protease
VPTDTHALRTRTVVFERAEGAPEGVVRGYVTTWDDPYNIGYGWNEEIARGAFSADLATRVALPIMYQHQWDAGPIGVTRSITEDSHGLLMEVQLFLDNERAASIYRAMEAKALREWSIGFYPEVIEENLETQTDRVTQGRMAEASVVVRGANPNTSTIEVRTEPPAVRCAKCDADQELEDLEAEEAARAAAEAANAEVPAPLTDEVIRSSSLRALVRDGAF